MERIMKKVKTGIWVAIGAFVALLIYQNRQFFMAVQSLRLDLWITEFQSPEWRIVMICTGFFAAGLILGMYILVIYHLRLRRKRKPQQVLPDRSDTAAEPDKAQQRISVQESAAKPEQSLPRGSDAETVVISPEVAPPVAERQDS